MRNAVPAAGRDRGRAGPGRRRRAAPVALPQPARCRRSAAAASRAGRGIRRRRNRAARGAYVESVGRRVAAYSGIANSGQAYRFTTLNSAVENAFAVPGGYVYITRQLMALMDDESELAFALGHEVGHIAANHAQARQSAARRNSILGVFGAVLGSVARRQRVRQLLSRR